MQIPVGIRYREFYDFPRMFIVEVQGRTFLFDGSFDDTLDDYPADYSLYLLPPLREDELAGSWAHLPSRATQKLGLIPTSAVVFDDTRREWMDASVLNPFLARRAG